VPDYTVTVAQRVTTPLTDDQVDALMDLMGEPAAMSVATDELAITTDATADDPVAALSLVCQLLDSVAAMVGVTLGGVEECEVLTVERQETQLADSDLPDLVGPTEAAELLGIPRQRVGQMQTEDPEFPLPLLQLDDGPQWLRWTMEAFAQAERAGRAS
jgi:hypothetical protein